MQPWLSRMLRQRMSPTEALADAEEELQRAYAKIEDLEAGFQKAADEEEDVSDELTAVRERAQELQAEVEELRGRVESLQDPTAAVAIAADHPVGRTLITQLGALGKLEDAVRRKAGEHHEPGCPRRAGVGSCACSIEELTRRLAL